MGRFVDQQWRAIDAREARRRAFDLRGQVMAHPSRQACPAPSLYRLADADEAREDAAAISEARRPYRERR